MPSPRWCITIGDQSRILTRHGRNPGAFRSFVMACPVVYERQVLRLGPVNQSVGWQPWWRGKAGGAGSGARGLVSRSRLSQITSCHLGSAGLAPTLSGENTRVNILSFQAPQKIFPGPSPRPAVPIPLSLFLPGLLLASWEGNLGMLNRHFKNLP